MAVTDREIPPSEAAKRLGTLPLRDLGLARVDTHRELRQVQLMSKTRRSTVDRLSCSVDRAPTHGHEGLVTPLCLAADSVAIGVEPARVRAGHAEVGRAHVTAV